MCPIFGLVHILYTIFLKKLISSLGSCLMWHNFTKCDTSLRKLNCELGYSVTNNEERHNSFFPHKNHIIKTEFILVGYVPGMCEELISTQKQVRETILAAFKERSARHGKKKSLKEEQQSGVQRTF